MHNAIDVTSNMQNVNGYAVFGISEYPLRVCCWSVYSWLQYVIEGTVVYCTQTNSQHTPEPLIVLGSLVPCGCPDC